jgi:hypothetical protein
MVSLIEIADSLQDASFGGVSFLYVDSRDEIGRRALRLMFPGSDAPSFQDLGQDDGTLRLTGMLIGDDYISQANALRTAFSMPGPQTLVHPWLGTMLAVLAGRAKFEDAQDSIRVTKFEAEFWRFIPRTPDPPGTLDALLGALSALKAAARALLAAVLAPVRLVLGVVSAVVGFASQVSAWVSIIAGGGLQILIASSLPGLAAIRALVPGVDYADTVAVALAAPSAALAAASNPPIPAAVGPGQDAETAAAIDGRITAAAMLDLATLVQTWVTRPAPAPSLALATACLVLADAAAAASDIAFTSGDEAITWRDRVTAALDAAAHATAGVAAGNPLALGAVWDALAAARAAWLADMNSTIGRLPRVATLALPAPALAWEVANFLSGDDPASIVTVFSDVVVRNRLHPLNLIAAPTLEVLQ